MGKEIYDSVSSPTMPHIVSHRERVLDYVRVPVCTALTDSMIIASPMFISFQMSVSVLLGA
jgi:hypothetical protein